MSPIVGVDPGKSGAVVKLHPQTMELEVWRDFKHEFDLADACREAAVNSTHAVIELVHAMPKQGVVSTFTFGYWTGGAAMALRSHGLTVLRPTPQSWQKWFVTHHGLAGRQAFDSREVALRLFPQYADAFRRKMDHNTADAALLAYWFWATSRR